MPSALEVWSLNHWTPWEVQNTHFDGFRPTASFQLSTGVMAVLGMPLSKNLKYGSSPSRLSRDLVTIPHHLHSPRQFRM